MVGVLSLGLFLRLWGIGFGLPRVQHADETALIYTAFSMAAEGGRPNVYVHGTVYPSIIAVFSGLYFLWGRLVGWFSDPSVFLVSFIKDPTVIVMFGRSLTVFFALASVWLVYRVGRQLFNARVGLLSSLFLAVSVLHVKESHYVKPDVLLGFVVLLLFLACFCISEEGAETLCLGGNSPGSGCGGQVQRAYLLCERTRRASTFNKQERGFFLGTTIQAAGGLSCHIPFYLLCCFSLHIFGLSVFCEECGLVWEHARSLGGETAFALVVLPV